MTALIKLNLHEKSFKESGFYSSLILFGFPAELSGADLFLADLKALEVYASYVYYTAKMWTKPLPETYDAEEVTEYFTLRPHVVALRLLEVNCSLISSTLVSL